MSMADEIRKALEPMTQEIAELTEKVDQLSLHVAELEAKQGELEKQIAAGLPAISEIKSAGAEAVAPLKQIANEIKDDLKKAGAEAVQQIKATKQAKDDDGETDWLKVAVVGLAVFAVMLIASAIPTYYWRYVPGNDYGYILFFNDNVSSNGKDGDLVIDLMDSTSEMNRKISEFYKRERERRQSN